jgi:hypothetical protein
MSVAAALGARKPAARSQQRAFPPISSLMAKKKMKLATWLVSKKLLTVEQAQKVMREQEIQTGNLKDRFGRIAVKMGFITEAALNKAILAKDRDEAEP